MNKTLQDLVWSILPKEFKDEVKRMYKIADSDVDQMIATIMLENVFGLHNLTSDAEGEEEMLCVKAKTIHEMYAANQRIMKDFRGSIDGINADLINHILRQLFGSKCLPDEVAHEDNFASKEPQPAEPKFKEGDRAIYCIPEKQRIKARVVNVRQRSGSTLFNTLFNYDIRLDDGRTANWVDEQWLLPDNDDQVRAVTEKASEQFDTIVKGGFRNERRLHIAAMAMQGILSNADRMKKYEYVATEPPYAELEVVVARKALRYADALIAECEKTDKNNKT